MANQGAMPPSLDRGQGYLPGYANAAQYPYAGYQMLPPAPSISKSTISAAKKRKKKVALEMVPSLSSQCSTSFPPILGTARRAPQ